MGQERPRYDLLTFLQQKGRSVNKVVEELTYIDSLGEHLASRQTNHPATQAAVHPSL